MGYELNRDNFSCDGKYLMDCYVCRTLRLWCSTGIRPLVEVEQSTVEIDIGRQLLIRCQSVGNFSGRVEWVDENNIPGLQLDLRNVALDSCIGEFQCQN